MKFRPVLHIYGLDIRSLGLFRIVLGLALLWDLVFFKVGLYSLLFSAESAMFPADFQHSVFGPSALSVLDILGSEIAEKLFFVFSAIVYMVLLLGYRSRLFSVIAFICFWSLSQRIAVFYNPAEMLTGSMLFLAMFLPLDKALAIRNPASINPGTVHSSPFTVLILLQLAIVYFLFALVRIEAELTAGKSILNYYNDLLLLRPWAAQLELGMTAGRIILIINVILCFAVPAGILINGKNSRWRRVAVIAIGIIAFVKIVFTHSGNWFLISLATMALLLPGEAWKNLHFFGTKETASKIREGAFSKWKSIIALVFGLIILHQNALTLAERPGIAAKVMKKARLTKVLKMTRLPRVERASLFNQNWVRGFPTAPFRYGTFTVEGNGERITGSRSFKNYCNAGLAVWRNEMHLTNTQTVFSEWLRYESNNGIDPSSIYYEQSPGRILVAGTRSEWAISEWIIPDNYYSYKGPVDMIMEGYGAPGKSSYITYQKAHHGYSMMVYAPVSEQPVPVILFTHAFFGHNYQIYHSLMEHVASWGYAFAFVPYRKGELNKDAEERRVRYADVWEGFDDIMTTLTDVIDTNKVVVAGHSYGGGAAASLSVKLFSETGWGQKAGGIAYFCPGYMEDIDQDELEALPADLQLMAQVYEVDTVTDAGMAWDFYEHSGIADSNKLFLVVESDTVDGYEYLANHYVPLQIGPNQYFDAYDYYAVFRPLNAFLLSVFEKDADARNYLFDKDSNEVVGMGEQLKPMRVMTEYKPLQKKDWYWAPCDHPENPRREFCP